MSVRPAPGDGPPCPGTGIALRAAAGGRTLRQPEMTDPSVAPTSASSGRTRPRPRSSARSPTETRPSQPWSSTAVRWSILRRARWWPLSVDSETCRRSAARRTVFPGAVDSQALVSRRRATASSPRLSLCRRTILCGTTSRRPSRRSTSPAMASAGRSATGAPLRWRLCVVAVSFFGTAGVGPERSCRRGSGFETCAEGWCRPSAVT